MTDIISLILIASIAGIAFALSFFYRWITANTASSSYPKKLRKLATYLPFISLLILSVFVFDYFDQSLNRTLGFTLIYLTMFIALLEFLFIIATLFNQQCRIVIGRAFNGSSAKRGRSVFMFGITAIGTLFGFIFTAIVTVIKAIAWAEAHTDTKEDYTSGYRPKNHHEDQHRLDSQPGASGYYDSLTGEYKRGGID